MVENHASSHAKPDCSEPRRPDEQPNSQAPNQPQADAVSAAGLPLQKNWLATIA